MNVSEIMSSIKKASPFDIFLISFFALPFVFVAWIDVFEKIGWGSTFIFWSLVTLSIFYVIIIAVLIKDNNTKKRKELARDLILGYLLGKGLKRISFDRVRNEINAAYNDDFLEELIQEFPKEVRRIKMKGGKVVKGGIGPVTVESSNDE